MTLSACYDSLTGLELALIQASPEQTAGVLVPCM